MNRIGQNGNLSIEDHGDLNPNDEMVLTALAAVARVTDPEKTYLLVAIDNKRNDGGTKTMELRVGYSPHLNDEEKEMVEILTELLLIERNKARKKGG